MRIIACVWIAVAWNGVIKYHGPRPSPAPNRIWVANHSSMIDYTILTAFMPFANIMQLQPGWVGFLQKRVLTCLGCLWFQRSEVQRFRPLRRAMRTALSEASWTDCAWSPYVALRAAHEQRMHGMHKEFGHQHAAT